MTTLFFIKILRLYLNLNHKIKLKLFQEKIITNLVFIINQVINRELISKIQNSVQYNNKGIWW